MPRRPAPAPLPKLIGSRELAKLWGFQARTVRNWMRSGDLGPCYDIRGDLRIEEARAAAFLSSCDISTGWRSGIQGREERRVLHA